MALDLKVALPQLRTDNWLQWKTVCENYLRVNDLWSIVTDEEPEPPPLPANPPPAAAADDERDRGRHPAPPDPVLQYRKRKHTAMFVLMAALSPAVYRQLQITDTTNPAQLWRLLTNTFEHRSRMSVLQVITALSSLRYDGSSKPSEWVTQRQKLYDELQASGEPVSHGLQVSATLLLLPSPAWDVVRSLVTNCQDRARADAPYTLDQLAAQLDDEWRLRGGQEGASGGNGSAAGLFARGGSQNNNFRGSKRGHSQNYRGFRGNRGRGTPGGQQQGQQGSRGGFKNNSAPKCFNCGGIGHISKNCSSPRQYQNPTNHPQNSRTPQKGARVAQVADKNIGFSATGFLSPGQILIDSGASQHMSGLGNYFLNYQPLKNPVKVRVANNQFIWGIGIGDLPLLLNVNGRRVRQLLLRCLHVPKLSTTLLSIRAADLSGISATFSNGRVELVDSDGIHRCHGILNNGCYMVQGRICGQRNPRMQPSNSMRCGIASGSALRRLSTHSRANSVTGNTSSHVGESIKRVVCPDTTTHQCFPQGHEFGEPAEVKSANRSCVVPIFSVNSVRTDAQDTVVTAQPRCQGKKQPSEGALMRDINCVRDTLDVPEQSTRYIDYPNFFAGGQVLAQNQRGSATVVTGEPSGGSNAAVGNTSNGNASQVAQKPNNDSSTRIKFPLSATSHFMGVPSGKSLSNLTEGRVLLAQKLSVHDWHRRLGHLGYSEVRQLLRGRLVTDMDCKGFETPTFCEPCALAKSKRIPFPHTATRRAKRVLELVHSDVCGPTQNLSLGGNQYFVTLIDDYSRNSFVRFIRHKSEVSDVLCALIRQLENQTDSQLKTIRTDRGGEYLNKAFAKFLRDKGVRHEQTCANSPQQNGVAERYNGVVAEKARAMLCESGLPPKFWAEAVATANYLRNISPTNANPRGKTPHQLWHRARPSVAHLRVFGSVAFSHLSPAERSSSKFGPRAEKGILVGYSDESKGYRIWFPKRGRVLVRRDVQFDESAVCSSETCQELICQPPAIQEERPTQVQVEEENTDQLLQEIDQQLQLPLLLPENQAELPLPNHRPILPAVPVVDPVVPMVDPTIPAAPEIQPNQVAPRRDLPVVPIVDPVNLPPALPIQLPPSPGTPVVRRLVEEAPEPDPVQEERRPETPPPLRRSAREHKAPNWFGDWYFAKAATTDVEEQDPNSWKAAMESDSAQDWKRAAEAEINSLAKFGVWQLVPKPPDRKIVGCRWVFRTKRGEHGQVIKHKARLVAKGFTQQYGTDYTDTFAPVVRWESVRAFLAVAVESSMIVHQLDVETAFLHGALQEEIYMSQPQGFVSDRFPDSVCLLKRSLYGLKQSPRCWNSALDLGLKECGFSPTIADPCIYTGLVRNSEVVLGVYVDDMLIASVNSEVIGSVKSLVASKFAIKDMGVVAYFLGVSVHQREQVIELKQPNYIDNLLHRFGMEGANPTKLPMSPDDTLEQCKDTDARTDKQLYQQIVGCLMYLATATRPDISFAVHKLGRYACDPGTVHLAAAKRVLAYLKGTRDLSLQFRRTGSTKLVCYVDSDWAGCLDSSRSTSGLVCLLAGGPIAWTSRRQRLVTKSTAEAEFVALSEVVCEVEWLRQLLMELGREQSGPTTVFEDNAAALALVNNPTSHQRTKHIMVKLRFVADRVENGTLQVAHIPTEDQIADGLTKPLPLAGLRALIRGLGMGGLATLGLTGGRGKPSE